MKQVTYSSLKRKVLSAFPLVIETILFTSTEIVGVSYMWFFSLHLAIKMSQVFHNSVLLKS